MLHFHMFSLSGAGYQKFNTRSTSPCFFCICLLKLDFLKIYLSHSAQRFVYYLPMNHKYNYLPMNHKYKLLCHIFSYCLDTKLLITHNTICFFLICLFKSGWHQQCLPHVAQVDAYFHMIFDLLGKCLSHAAQIYSSFSFV